MRRICSLVWNDIRKTQKIGNRKNSPTSSQGDGAQDASERVVIAPLRMLIRPGRARAGAANA